MRKHITIYAELAALLFFLVFFASNTSYASVIQFSQTTLSTDDADEDTVLKTTSAEITRASVATISGFQSFASTSAVYTATSVVGQFGSVGISAALSGAHFDPPPGTPYELNAGVVIASDEFANLSGSPAHAVINFIIDGGEMSLFVGKNASVNYLLRVESENLGLTAIDSGPLFVGTADASFESRGNLSFDALGVANFTQGGNDIGASETSPGTVEIPISFQTVDLGIVGPGDRLLIQYTFNFSISLGADSSFLEGAFAEFSDPLAPSLSPVFEVNFTPDTMAAAPEPATIILLCIGLASFGAMRYRT